MVLLEFSKRLKAWQQKLNSTSGWDAALNDAFDRVGFTEEYVANVDARKKLWANRRKAVKDNIWGMIEFSHDDGEIIDSPLMQRMRSIRQNGLTFLTYPNANHTRFEHSLGVFEVVGRLLDSAILTAEAYKNERDGGVTVNENLQPVSYSRPSREYRLIRHAALLHDVGHAPFSHVSEKVFKTLDDKLNIGPISVKEFTDLFRLEYSLPLDLDSGTDETRARPRSKGLSELLSVAILLSERFSRFYRAVCYGDNTFNEDADIYDLGALILGDRISQNDFALPEVLSGPVDADKIDYLVRDSRACGINVGIDVARVFLRAGVYKAKASTGNALGLESIDQQKNVKLFLIDPSGSDAVRELGTSRLSLYDRVYYHQYTRKAEHELLKVFRSCANSADPNIGRFKCLLSTWATSEDYLLDTLCLSTDVAVQNGSRRIKSRSMPKRVAMLSREFVVDPVVPCGEFEKSCELQVDEIIEQIFRTGSLTSVFSDGNQTSERTSEFFSDASRLLNDMGAVDGNGYLPTKPPVGFIPPPKQVDADPKPALILMNDTVVRFGEDESARLFAGAVRLNKGIVTAPDGARETALLALEKSLFLNCLETDLALSKQTGDVSSPQSTSPLEVKGLILPRLDISLMLRQFKLNGDRLKEYREHLLNEGFYEGLQHLVPYEDDQKVSTITKKFATFQGEHGWKIDENHTRRFIEQFPVRLRGQISKILLNDFYYMERGDITSDARDAIQKIAADGEWFAGPLSLSSGMALRTAMRDSIELTNVTFVSSPSGAIERAAFEGGKVLLIDDNIASGTQAKRQISILFGKEEAPNEKNYFSDKLSAEQIAFVRENGIAFAFAAAYQDGVNELTRFVGEQQVKQDLIRVEFGKALEDTNVASKLTHDLKCFLSEVGRQVLAQRFEREGKDNPVSEAEKHALGYSSLQSAYAHSLNVPTTTLTAFWCPGVVSNSVRYSADETRDFTMPWLPLLLRSKHTKYMAIGL